jgi:hypothetical protein
MTRQIVVLATVTSLLITACQIKPKTASGSNITSVAGETRSETKITAIAFKVAKNYFAIDKKLDNPKIETAEKFNEFFGMAALMGEEGRPTEIDFTKQFVIAVLKPVTHVITTIEPVSLQKNEKNEIILTYKTIVGEKQTYSTLPNFAIIVNKAETGNIILIDKK